MTLEFQWQGLVRQTLASRDWNVSNRARTNWIKWLDEAHEAFVRFDLQERTVELKMMSSVDGIPYCAGLFIEINDFDELYNQIISSFHH